MAVTLMCKYVKQSHLQNALCLFHHRCLSMLLYYLENLPPTQKLISPLFKHIRSLLPLEIFTKSHKELGDWRKKLAHILANFHQNFNTLYS